MKRIGMLLALMLGAAAMAQAITLQNGDRLDLIEAQVICKDQVRDVLTAPRTAKFPGAWGGNFNQPEMVGNAWHYIVVVDSQNAFGVEFRSEILCVLDGDTDNISLEQLN